MQLASGPWAEDPGAIADGVARGADVDIVGMLRAEGEVQEVRAVGWAQQVGTCLLAPVVSHMVPPFYHAGQHQAAVPVLLGPV